ncbi:MAG TPA: hypothetical protein VMD59_16340 [Acidimicrobiales bacterium]|nr:hypothetical protein [Acidimicrobiales bacterium]
MLLTIATTHRPATDLGYLLHKHPDGVHRFTLAFGGLISHYVLDGGRLVVAHAGLRAEMHGRASGAVRSSALYGDTTGETDELGLPVRYPWAEDYRGEAMVVYGHTPVPEASWLNRTICIDTGCVFGGRLTALRHPERELVSVAARRVYWEPARPLAAATARPAGREPTDLDLDDVVGKRIVETRRHGSVTIREENAAAALEVMSRFAADPRWIVYLPPTMAPTATSEQPGLLEHPAEAFASYRRDGVERVVCEEKHMGSRALVVVCRTPEVAAKRFAVEGHGPPGAVLTRTGRPFFERPGDEAALLGKVVAALAAAGLWEELASDWAVLDCELLPWSAKAGELLRRQYASVGVAASTALSAEVEVLERLAARGVDGGDLLARRLESAAMAAAFVEAYRRCCWTVGSVDDLRLAPFQVLAGEGSVHALSDHLWHLEVLGRLCEVDAATFSPTSSVTVVLGDAASEAAATAWWEELTARGGEGMVVKPLEVTMPPVSRADAEVAALDASAVAGEPATASGTATGSAATGPAAGASTRPRASRGPGRVQPGIKCRGREYLRLIYGPEYTAEANLSRLRRRGLGHKRSLALREHALGIEALERFVAGEPLYRVHECVFGILALESEAVDPRL